MSMNNDQRVYYVQYNTDRVIKIARVSDLCLHETISVSGNRIVITPCPETK